MFLSLAHNIDCSCQIAVVAIAALAVYYAAHNGGSEEAVVQDMGGAKLRTKDFDALRAEMERYDPDFDDRFSWEARDSWSEFFCLQGELLSLQHDYIADCKDSENIRTELYNEATALDTAATEAEQAAEDVDTATPPLPDPCKDQADKIRQLLYGNKHAENSYGPAGGTHGYINRML